MGRANKHKRLFLPYLAVILLFGILASLSGYLYIKKEGRNKAQKDLIGRLDFIRNQINIEVASIQKLLRLADNDEPISSIRFHSGLDYVYITPYNSAIISQNLHIKKSALEKSGSGGILSISIAELSKLGRHLLDKSIVNVANTNAQNQNGIVIEYSLYCKKKNDGGDLIITGGKLLNGNNEWIDAIKNSVTGYNAPESRNNAAASLFAGDVRIATTLCDPTGVRLTGTKMPDGIADLVYGNHELYAGRVEIGGSFYLSAYRSIKSNTKIALAIAISEEPYIENERKFIIVLIILMGLSVICAAVIAMHLSRLVEKSEQELKDANKRLEELNASYINMVGIVSHDLKNILSSVGLNVNAVSGGHYGPLTDKQKQALSTASQTLDYFEATVRNFLDYTRFEGQTPPLNHERINLLSEIIQPALDSFKPQIDKNGITVYVKIDPNEVIENGDKANIKIAINNLLSNAVKYTPNHGMIEIMSSKENSKTRIEIYNSSIVIDENERKSLFTPFSKINTTGKRAPGTGLGLYITRKIAEAHGGYVAHEPGSTGNTFIIVI